jgi:hypothetical protein
MKTKGRGMVALAMCTGVCLAGDSRPPPSLLDEYKTYSLARCITNNYSSMGVKLGNTSIADYTMGFIDIEEGYALGVSKDNQLDNYIREKTAEFHKPKQTQGDASKTNLVIYDCVDFYKSDDLDSFLGKLLKYRH